MSLVEPENDKKVGKAYELFYTDCKLPVKSGKERRQHNSKNLSALLVKVTKQTAKVLKITLSVCTIFFCGVY